MLSVTPSGASKEFGLYHFCFRTQVLVMSVSGSQIVSPDLSGIQRGINSLQVPFAPDPFHGLHSRHCFILFWVVFFVCLFVSVFLVWALWTQRFTTRKLHSSTRLKTEQVCVCVCGCVSESESERERVNVSEWEREGDRERERWEFWEECWWSCASFYP